MANPEKREARCAYNVIALVPARVGSVGIPNKNFRELAGASPLKRAVLCAWDAGVERVVITTDHPTFAGVITSERTLELIHRPSELAGGSVAMIAVVQHALKQIPGPPEQIIVLLQPTQPLRKPAHVTAAVALLRETQSDSVVSVMELPLTYSPHLLCGIFDDRLQPWLYDRSDEYQIDWAHVPIRRQDAAPAYLRDGTVYAFWRGTVEHYGNLYGRDVCPLIIPASETCPLDTPEDWADAERRLRA